MAAPVPAQAAAQQMQQQPQDTPAQAVGNQFVSQYYTVQHASPRHLHRFYSDASTLTIGDVRPDGFFSKSATGQKTIHELVMDLGYEDTSTEIYTVDSQYSLGGGVVVQVTGIMQRPGGPKRPFVQTFFLAVQEKGYYVLNDVFRYLPLVPLPADNGGAPGGAAPAAIPRPTSANPPAAPIVPPPAAPVLPPGPAAAASGPAAMPPQQLPLQQAGMQPGLHAGEQANGMPVRVPPQPPVAVQYTGYAAAPGAAPAVPPPPQPAPIGMPVPVPLPTMPGTLPPPAATAAAESPPAAVPPPRGPPPPAAAAGAAPPPRQQPPPKPAAEAARPPEPLSYAERLRQGSKASAPSSPRKQPQQPSSAPLPAAALQGSTAEQPSAPAASPVPPATEEAPPARQQAPQQAQQPRHQQAADAIPLEDQPTASVFVRGIPASVTAEQLVQRLEQYGRVRPGGVILKSQKGRDSFAFIDFEDPTPAQVLLRQGMEIDGVQLQVQPKRPLIFRPALRSDGGRSGPNGEMGGRPGQGRFDGGAAGGGRGERGFRPGRGGGRGPYPHGAADGRGGAVAGPPRGSMAPPQQGATAPGQVPAGPAPARMDGRGYGQEAQPYGGGGRGYGGGRGRGRSGPPPAQQQAPVPSPQPGE